MAQNWEAHFSKGVIGSRPAANTLPKGAIYYATDEAKFYVGAGVANTWADFTAAFALASDLAAKAPLASPTFTGTPAAPTASGGTNTTQIATTAFVQAAVTALINAAPGALDTLDELAAALGDDASFAATMTTALALKAPLASPTFTGTPAAPTAAANTNTTQVATTANVVASIAATKLDDLATPDDNTDLNASTSRHGLLRKLSNTATEYLDGTGAWSTPAGGGGGGGGGLVLLEQYTASASATLDFTTAITSTYDTYVFELLSLVPGTTGSDLLVRLSTDGGATFDTTSIYKYTGHVHAGNTDGAGTTTASAFNLTVGNSAKNTATSGVDGTLRLASLLSATIHKRAQGQFCWIRNSDSLIIGGTFAGQYESATAVNAVRFLFSSGNISTGIVRCYGVAKS